MERKHLSVNKFVEMEKDLKLIVMMEITRMEMVAIKIVKLKKDILAKEDLQLSLVIVYHLLHQDHSLL